MIVRIEIIPKCSLSHIMFGTAYLLDTHLDLDETRILELCKLFHDPIAYDLRVFIYENNNFQDLYSGEPYSFNQRWCLEIAMLPHMTDNLGNTAKEIICEFLKYDLLDDEKVVSYSLLFGDGDLPVDITQFYNPVIKYCRLLTKDGKAQFYGNSSIKKLNCIFQDTDVGYFALPYVRYSDLAGRLTPQLVTTVDLEVSDEELEQIAIEGVNGNGSLGLSLAAMKAIQLYFRKYDRNPTDIEIEALAQTWSEHCKHNIFSAKIDDIEKGLYRHYIKRATAEIASQICVSVFADNAGGIIFDDDFLIVDKVETHNSPSALDPLGGAMTGILGVNRDIIGFGKGAKVIANTYYYCFSKSTPFGKLYRDSACTEPILSPEFVAQGVIEGVNIGGNCSGVPTVLGSVYFHDNFCGKPLVFVGSVGLIPRSICGKLSHFKAAEPGDYVVVIGGRVGRDGIHGATFSSAALEERSPITVVQIGDPITQKKMADAIIKEARDLDLYNAITDNGAGGLSSSVGEMGAKGFKVELAKVPLKYHGMLPWEIWVSESQERMTLAIPPHKFALFAAIMKKHDVEVAIIGEFNNTGRAVVTFNDLVIMDIETDFLHNGNPHLCLQTKECPSEYKKPICRNDEISTAIDLIRMIGRPNICSKEFICVQYDHEVQGGSILKPLQGRGRVQAEAVIFRPLLSSIKGVVKSQGFSFNYGEIDPYHMSACAIDAAVRNYVAAGGNLKHLALLDNFCWSDSTNPERLWQLKRAVQGCYDYALAFKAPFISGKDSMFNDFHGYSDDHKKVIVSAPPSLLISTIGVIDNIENSVSLDVKMPGDLIYVLGTTHDELGGSEYQLYTGIGMVNVPKVNAHSALLLYDCYGEAVKQNLIASAIAINRGGMIISLLKALIGGQLGANVDLYKIPTSTILDYSIVDKIIMFSESQSRLLVTVAPQNQSAFEAILGDIPYANIGTVISEYHLNIRNIANLNLGEVEQSYKSCKRVPDIKM